MTSRLHPAFRFLCELRKAGSDVFIDDDQLFVSPPRIAVAWPGDVEAEIERLYWELKELVAAENAAVVP